MKRHERAGPATEENLQRLRGSLQDFTLDHQIEG